MTRIAYVNGQYVRHEEACVHIEDRGYQLADGVYEVWAVRDGLLMDHQEHIDRLRHSLGELKITTPCSPKTLEFILRETLRRNSIKNGLAYLQITRGVAPRSHAFPEPAIPPSMIITARPANWTKLDAKAAKGVSVVSSPDQRWARCDIKSIALLPNVLAKQAAVESGAHEAWLIDNNGFVTEGTSSAAFIIDAHQTLITRPLAHDILPSITRLRLMQEARLLGLKVEECLFRLEEAKQAAEAFMAGAGSTVLPVISVDGTKIGSGEPGPISQKLRAAYIADSIARAKERVTTRPKVNMLSNAK